MRIADRFALYVGVAQLHRRWLLWQLASERDRNSMCGFQPGEMSEFIGCCSQANRQGDKAVAQSIQLHDAGTLSR
jgi:hypothetical protein